MATGEGWRGDDEDERMVIERMNGETGGEETTGKPIARTTVKARFKAGCSRILENSGLEWETRQVRNGRFDLRS